MTEQKNVNKINDLIKKVLRMKIIYPDYMPNWSGSRGRLYPSKEEVLETNPKLRE
jgi:hypothetical protein